MINQNKNILTEETIIEKDIGSLMNNKTHKENELLDITPETKTPFSNGNLT